MVAEFFLRRPLGNPRHEDLPVYDAHDRVGSVVKRDDQHYAYTVNGKLIDVFRSRIEAAPAIPAKGSAS